MTSKSPQKCPFIAGPAITDSRFFVGRQDELNIIKSRMTGPQPISVNVVGRHQIGKSSLLLHFYKKCKSSQSRYVVIYLCLQDAKCQLESTFYAAIAEELQNHPVVKAQPDLIKLLQVQTWDRVAFSETIEKFQNYYLLPDRSDLRLLPVLCLDKFDALFQNSGEFNNGFYDNLHSLINHNNLMLVVATLKKLQVYRDGKQLTSSFFNVGHVLPLEEFSEEEADKLVRLPESTVPGSQTALLPKYQRLAKKWGKRDPYLLQLAASWLWEAQKRKKDVAWAQKEFKRQLESQPQTKPDRRSVSPVLAWMFLKFPKRLGGFVKTPGVVVSEITTWGVGISLCVLMVLVVVGLIPGNRVHHQLKMFLCSTLSSALSEKLCK